MRRFMMTLALVGTAAGQTVLLREDFNGGWSTTNPPPGWTIIWDGDTSDNDWHRADPGTPRWPDNPTPFALLDSFPLEFGGDSLISPVFSCVGLNVVQLRCSTYFRGSGGALYFAQLLLSVNNEPYIEKFNYYGRTIGPGVQTIPLPEAANQPDCRLAWFFGEGTSNSITCWALDNVTVTGAASTVDVGCEAILEPTGRVDSDQVVVPTVVVRNYSSEPADFPLHMFISPWYHDSLLVENFPGNTVDTFRFNPWLADRRGNHDLLAYTLALGDVNPRNDTVRANCQVWVTNVTVEAITSPPDTVDSSAAPIIPRARVFNQGLDTAADFYVWMKIGNWRDSVFIDSFLPGEVRDVPFRSWSHDTTGPVAVVCSVYWSPDRYPSDDVRRRTCFVRGLSYTDVGAQTVLSPARTVRESSFVIPRGVIKNNGARPATVATALRIFILPDSLVYVDSANAILQPHQLDTIAFTQWFAVPAETMRVQLTVALPGDMNPANDTFRAGFRVRAAFHDVGCPRISFPRDTIYTGVVTPAAWVVNYGSFLETFRADFRITRGPTTIYYNSQTIAGLGVGESLRVQFASWEASTGACIARCSTALDGDATPGNNLALAPFWVESLAVEPGWHEVESMPRSPSGKPVKAGGALAATPGGRIYGLKGNKTSDFYVYLQGGDSWRALRPVPAGEEDKPVAKGASLCADGQGTVFAVKGNNTLGFYGYDIARDTWRALPPVLPGASGKKVKQGSKTVYVVKGDTGWVYLLKGYKNEFMKFNTVAGRWDTTRSAPAGAKPSYKEGSFITYDGDATIYCLKATYNEFFRFDVRGDTWYSTRLRDLPLSGMLGKKKKLKAGGSGAWYDGRLLCLKGGNTQEFWVYTAATDSWNEMDTIPAVGRSGAKKKVKDGGSLVAAGATIFYALKGGKCDEFWRYRIPSGAPGVSEGSSSWKRPRCLVTICHGVLFLPPWPLGRRAALFDLTGREVMALSSGSNDVTGLAPGVYFLRTAGHSGQVTEAKVIIQ